MDKPRFVHFVVSSISRSDPLHFLMWGFVKDEIYFLPMPIILNNLNDRIRTAIAKTYHLLLQNVWHEVEYRLHVCRATNGAQTELHREWKLLSCSLQWSAFNFCVAFTFLPINCIFMSSLVYQDMIYMIMCDTIRESPSVFLIWILVFRKLEKSPSLNLG